MYRYWIRSCPKQSSKRTETSIKGMITMPCCTPCVIPSEDLCFVLPLLAMRYICTSSKHLCPRKAILGLLPIWASLTMQSCGDEPKGHPASIYSAEKQCWVRNTHDTGFIRCWQVAAPHVPSPHAPHGLLDTSRADRCPSVLHLGHSGCLGMCLYP